MTMRSVLPTLAFSLLLLAPTSAFAALINNSLRWTPSFGQKFGSP